MIFQQRKASFHRMTVNAHRGWSAKYPENTVLAFEQAIRIGADYIELDIRECRDGTLVISHDSDLKRCAFRLNQISELSVEQLHQINVGRGQYVPTLEEVLQLCQGKIGIHLEIKENGLCARIASLIQKYHMEQDVIFSSFQHIELLRIREFIPTAITAPIISFNAFATPSRTHMIDAILYIAKLFQAQGLHLRQNLISEDIVTKIHAHRCYVNVWVVDTPKSWETLEKLHVDGVFTNKVSKLIEYFKK
jgi:glycerophosphoryl diester phosphodiesterase